MNSLSRTAQALLFLASSRTILLPTAAATSYPISTTEG